MSQNLYQEAIAEAKKLREVAESESVTSSSPDCIHKDSERISESPE